MDKFLTLHIPIGQTSPMGHFGHFLRNLREQRGLTQSQLADRAGSSLSTLQRGEMSSACTWRKRLANEVFEALDRRARLTEAERTAYFAFAGMKPPEETPPTIPTTLVDQPDPPALTHRRATPRATRFRTTAEALAPDPDHLTAAVWVERMIAETGPIRVLAALEALAISWGIDLPPRARATPTTPLRAIQIPADTADLNATIYTPTAKPPSSRKRKSA